jgi:hypothetical protein
LLMLCRVLWSGLFTRHQRHRQTGRRQCSQLCGPRALQSARGHSLHRDRCCKTAIGLCCHWLLQPFLIPSC